MNSTLMDDPDLAGPLFFLCCLGMLLLLAGKVHFGYLYGLGVVAVLSMYTRLHRSAKMELYFFFFFFFLIF
jgi:hypothetical protein